MAEKVREFLTDVSIYVKGLESEARKRYYSKLMFNKGLKTLPDPYKVADEKWSRDLTNWPSLDFGQLYNYLILSPALFNPTSMRNYKSLEAYRYVNMFINLISFTCCVVRHSVYTRSPYQKKALWRTLRQVCRKLFSANFYHANEFAANFYHAGGSY